MHRLMARPMAKREMSVTSQVLAHNHNWRLTCNTSRAGHITYFLAKKSGYIEPYKDETEAFAACERRGLKISVRKDVKERPPEA
jgi:hypothetical protein